MRETKGDAMGARRKPRRTHAWWLAELGKAGTAVATARTEGEMAERDPLEDENLDAAILANIQLRSQAVDTNAGYRAMCEIETQENRALQLQALENLAAVNCRPLKTQAEIEAEEIARLRHIGVDG